MSKKNQHNIQRHPCSDLQIENNRLREEIQRLQQEKIELYQQMAAAHESDLKEVWQRHYNTVNFLFAYHGIEMLMQTVDTAVLSMRNPARLLIDPDKKEKGEKQDIEKAADQMLGDLGEALRLADRIHIPRETLDTIQNDVTRYQEGVRQLTNKDDGGTYLERLALERDPQRGSFVRYRDSLKWGGRGKDEVKAEIGRIAATKPNPGRGNMNKLGLDVLDDLYGIAPHLRSDLHKDCIGKLEELSHRDNKRDLGIYVGDARMANMAIMRIESEK